MSTRPAPPEQIAARHGQLNPPARTHFEAHLFEPGLGRCILTSYAILWAGTALFALVAIPFASPLHEIFGLSGGLATPGTTNMAALTLANNAREAAIPFLFAALRVGARRWSIVVGDVVTAACFTVDVALGGLALGSDGIRALPYLPQWPLEWGGLAVALTAWRRSRRGRRDPLELALLAIATALLLCVAALLETYAVPQS